MTFLVEDGAGVELANAYCTTSFVDSYAAERNLASVWSTLSGSQKEYAIIKATDFIEMQFSAQFKGVKEFLGSSYLSFPRLYISETGIPLNLKKACAEYALRACVNPLISDPVSNTTGVALKREKKKIGPIETETEFQGSVVKDFRRYPSADLLLKSLLVYSAGVTR
jgi:hypothetical protein